MASGPASAGPTPLVLRRGSLWDPLLAPVGCPPAGRGQDTSNPIGPAVKEDGCGVEMSMKSKVLRLIGGISIG